MAIVLEANYAKKLGLPNFSSHQYSVTIRMELSDLSQAGEESSRLYQLLQDAVDREIQEVGFLPDATTYGMNNGASSHGNGSKGHEQNGNSRSANHLPFSDWHCTEGQRNLILKIVRECSLDKDEVEALAQEHFGAGVKQLDKLQASQLIEELEFPRENGQVERSGCV